MNGKLIAGLSLLGMVMAFATTYLISSRIEPFCWLPVFIISAWLIGKHAEGKYFLHGFLTNMLNSAWVVIVHISLADAYLAHLTPKEAEGYQQMTAQGIPMAVSLGLAGIMIGLFSGVILGAFSSVAARLMGKGGEPTLKRR